MANEAKRPVACRSDLAERVGALRLLACLLATPPDRCELGALAGLRSRSAFASSVARIAEAAMHMRAETVADEFQRLFIGLGGGELTPYASHYLAGSLHDVPLIRLRQDMRRLGLAPSRDISEPEDHAATVLEIAAVLLDGSTTAATSAAREFSETHVLSWLPKFFEDLSRAQNAPFYAAAGALGVAVMAEERRSQPLEPLTLPAACPERACNPRSS